MFKILNKILNVLFIYKKKKKNSNFLMIEEIIIIFVVIGDKTDYINIHYYKLFV
jgi:hypothetical protein